MISRIKYTAFVILCLVFLLFCGETAGQTLADRTDEYGEHISFNRIYGTVALKANIIGLAEKYDCRGFVIQSSYGEEYVNTYYFLPGSEDGAERSLGIKDCSFNTLTGPRVTLKTKAFEALPETETIGELFIAGEGSRSFVSELREKYELTVAERQSHFSLPLIAGLVSTVLFLLLALYDVLSRKRDVCIALTLGRGLMPQILCFWLKDTLVYAASAPLVFALLYRLTAAVLCIREYLLFVLVQALCSAMMYLVLFKADICASLKNENGSHRLLLFNYILKTLSSAIFISALMLSGEIGTRLLQRNNARELGKQFEGFNVTDIELSAYQAKIQDEILSRLDLIEIGSEEEKELNRYFDDLAVFYEECSRRGDVFFLNALSPTFEAALKGREPSAISPDVIYASDSAGGYISSLTGAELDAEKISVLVPEKHTGKDLELARAFAETYSEDYTIEHYKSAAVACFGYSDNESVIPSSGRVCFLSDPVIVYFPSSEKYGYLGLDHYFGVSLDKDETDRLLQDRNIKSLEVGLCSVGYCADKFMFDSYSQAVLYGVMLTAIALYSLIIFASTVMLDIRLRRRDRAIGLVLGESFINRSLPLTLPLLLSCGASVIIAAALCGAIGIKGLGLVPLAGAMILCLELCTALAAIRRGEKKEGYILSSLKGGAL